MINATTKQLIAAAIWNEDAARDANRDRDKQRYRKNMEGICEEIAARNAAARPQAAE